MGKITIFWDPSGFQLDALGRTTYLRSTDGDTPYVSSSIRMLSIDTPEVHYPGNQKPSKQDAKLAELADWIQAGHAPITDGLAEHLHPRLVTGTAGTLQQQQGEQAHTEFEKLLEQKLTRPSGRKRPVFLWLAEERFDKYGRMLAYMAPSYSREELATISRHERATFNLLLVESGWAASFPIYPSLPRYRDLVMLHDAAKSAFDEPRGAWTDPQMLTGYEFRMCVKLYDVTKKLAAGKSITSKERYGWISRYCADMTTRTIFDPPDYHRVPAYNRIFIWPKDVTQAVGQLNLVPAD